VDDTMRKWIEATLAGKRRSNIDRVGVSYMLQGEAGGDQNDLSVKTPKGKDRYYVGPHVMLALPDNDKLALKYLNRDISTSELHATSLKSSSPILLIPIARPHQEVRIGTNNGN
jgi:hypothetical protein